MKILHIIREIDDKRALETVQAHATDHQVTVVLLQDAVLGRFSWEGEVYACGEDLEARGVAQSFQGVDYRDLVRMIFGHDRVVMW